MSQGTSKEQQENKAVLLAIKGHLFDLPESEQKKVTKLAKEFKKLIKENGEAGALAFAMVGAELAAED